MTSAVVALTLADAVAVVDEERCIGCTLCIKACPVDAIVGAAKSMHTVVAEWCTGCELCVPPCPVDCIDIQPIASRDAVAREAALASARRRHEAHYARLDRMGQQTAARLAAQREAAAAQKKRDTIRRAVERARQRLRS